MIENSWQPLPIQRESGLLGERVSLWRNHRLWHMAESGYLNDGFEKRPGVHPWQGEHLGKWLHAAVLAWRVTGDEKIKREMASNVERLLATQLPDGYLGTYDSESTFVAMPERGAVQDDVGKTLKRGGWDIWTHRYNLYGLLTYEQYFPDERIVDACRKMADLLIRVYGEGGSDITHYGTREGISSTTLLESIVMLYERTGENAYLEFAKHMVDAIENNPRHRLMGTMLDGGSVVLPGDGKGYQLMANLLGFIHLFRCTKDQRYLETAIKGWEQILSKHILVTGGPWTRKMEYNGNVECFAYTENFHPEKVYVEGCCDATWMQLNIHLFELTGEARYMDEAEKTLLNSLYGHQHDDGIKWCYYTTPNQASMDFTSRLHCCASSMPRGMEMLSAHLIGEIDGAMSINGLFSFTAELPDQFGEGSVTIESDYPFGSSATITLQRLVAKSFRLEFRVPSSIDLETVRINGDDAVVDKNDRGFYEINRLWEKGDVIDITYARRLESHIQAGEEGNAWVAFNLGPLALAEQATGDMQPVSIDGSNPVESILRLVELDGKNIRYRIEGTGIDLVPYFRAGTDTTGTRTYFPAR